MFHKPRHPVMIACFPKSGSTFLREVLVKLTGYAYVHPVIDAPPFGHTLSETKLRKCGRNWVTQIHVVASTDNLRIADRWGIKPVVLVRSVFDIVPSLADYWDRIADTHPFSPTMRKVIAMPTEARHTWIIRNRLPWYLTFFQSWIDAAEQLDTHWLCYERLFADPAVEVRRVVDHLGLSFSEAQIDDALAAARGTDTKLNKGVSGRGRAVLTDQQVQWVYDLAGSWPLSRSHLHHIDLADE